MARDKKPLALKLAERMIWIAAGIIIATLIYKQYIQ